MPDHDAVAAPLAQLQASAGYLAERFDDGPAFGARVAALPSAFNPPTIAHLGLLELAHRLPDVQSVAALLTTSNVDKGLTGASLAHRIAMLLELRRSHPFVSVLATNAARFVDQASALRTSFPAVQFDFVVGYDTLVRLFSPVYYTDMHRELEPFFARHRLIAANRGEADIAAVERFLDSPEVVPFRDAITVLELDPERAALSSTLARTAAANGNGHEGPVVAEVAQYITKHGLYRD